MVSWNLRTAHSRCSRFLCSSILRNTPRLFFLSPNRIFTSLTHCSNAERGKRARHSSFWLHRQNAEFPVQAFFYDSALFCFFAHQVSPCTVLNMYMCTLLVCDDLIYLLSFPVARVIFISALCYWCHKAIIAKDLFRFRFVPKLPSECPTTCLSLSTCPGTIGTFSTAEWSSNWNREMVSIFVVSIFCAIFFPSLSFAQSKPTRLSCSIGTYYNGTRCLKCPAGTYQDEPGQKICKKCPKDSASPHVGVGFARFCEPCPWILYTPAGSAKCNLCPKGFTSVRGGKCFRCKPGTRVTPNGCKKCSPRHFNPNFNAYDCSECPPYTISSDDRTKCVKRKCPPGFSAFYATEPCKRCHYHTLPDGSKSSCGACPKRYYAPTNSSTCQLCPPGTFASSATDNMAFTNCEECDEGSTTIGYGKALCKTRGKSCPKGFFLDADGDCDSCTIEEYRDVQENKCKPCPSGQYGHGGLATNCTSCLPGQKFNGFFALYLWDNHVCACPHGTVLKDGRCTPCPKGTYNSPYSMDFCKKCDDDSYADQVGSTSCKKCPAGTSSIPTNGKSCTKLAKCPKGYAYLKSYLKNGCISLVNGCPKNMERKQFGWQNNTSCVRPNGKPWCPAGTVFKADSCFDCSDGYYIREYDIDWYGCESCYGYSRGGTAEKCEECSSGYFGRDGRCICQATLYINEYGNCVPCTGFVSDPPDCYIDSYYYP